jgi:hypothetical protein
VRTLSIMISGTKYLRAVSRLTALAREAQAG